MKTTRTTTWNRKQPSPGRARRRAARPCTRWGAGTGRSRGGTLREAADRGAGNRTSVRSGVGRPCRAPASPGSRSPSGRSSVASRSVASAVERRSAAVGQRIARCPDGDRGPAAPLPRGEAGAVRQPDGTFRFEPVSARGTWPGRSTPTRHSPTAASRRPRSTSTARSGSTAAVGAAGSGREPAGRHRQPGGHRHDHARRPERGDLHVARRRPRPSSIRVGDRRAGVRRDSTRLDASRGSILASDVGIGKRTTQPLPRMAVGRHRPIDRAVRLAPRARPARLRRPDGPAGARALGHEAWAAALDYLYDHAFVRAMGEPRRLRASCARPSSGRAARPAAAPLDPTPSADLLDEFRTRVAPHQLNAYHPRSLSYFTPPPLAMSVVGELLAQVTQQGVDVWHAGPARDVRRGRGRPLAVRPRRLRRGRASGC